MATPAETQGVIRSLIPARIDRLPWSPFHTRMVVALGVAWILDGLEITVASAVADTLTQPETLGLSSAAVGLIATVYLAGEVVGALFFGRLSDKLGRRNLFMITLGVYLVGSGLTAFTLGNSAGWIVYLYITRFIAGMGIGGEYAAINSAIDELIPARFRGRVDIAINGTYWAGAILGTLGTFIFLKAIDLSLGWRLAFLIGPVLGLVILLVRRNLPESPRWQVMNGRVEAAERSITHIEHEVESTGATLPAVDDSKAIELQPTEKIGYLALTRVLFRDYPSRSMLGAVAHDQPVVSVQRDLLHLHPGARQVLRGGLGVGAAVPDRVRRREPRGAVDPRALLRHHRPQEDDHRHLPAVRSAAGRERGLVQRWGAQRNYPDHCLVRHLLFRVGRGQRRLPHRERDLSAGGSGEGDRGVLRHRPMLWGPRSGHLRRAHRRWLPALPAVPGLLARCGSDDGRRTGRLVPRGRCRRQVAGRHRHPTGSRRRPPPDGFSPCGGSNPALLALSPGRIAKPGQVLVVFTASTHPRCFRGRLIVFVLGRREQVGISPAKRLLGVLLPTGSSPF